MRIQHNIMAMNSYRNYNNNTSALSKNLEKLSSGYKINRAGDDAAGLAISEKMRAQITGLDAAQKNVKDAVSFVKTAEGAMQEVQDMLKRMKYLATQSANGTYQDDVDREALQDEVNSLLEEIDRIAQSANFNGIYMLNGPSGSGTETTEPTAPTAEVDATNAAGVGDVTLDFAADASSAQKTALSTALAGSSFKVTTTDGDGATTFGAGDKVKLEGLTLPTGYTATFKDAVGNDAAFTDNTDITVGTAAGNLKAGDNLVLTLKDADGNEAGTLTIDLTSAKDDGASGPLSSTVTFAAAEESAPAGQADDAAAAESTLDGTLGTAIATGGTPTLDASGLDLDAIKAAADKIDGTADGDLMIEMNATSKKLELKIGDKVIGTSDEVVDGNGQSFTFKDADGNALGTVAASANLADTDMTGAVNTGAIYAAAAEDEGGDGAGGAATGSFTITMQIGDTAAKHNQLTMSIKSVSTASIGVSGLDISNRANAAAAIQTITDAINDVSSTRGQLGAYQNRLEHTQNNLSVMAENITDAESTIRDTDVAEEMMSYVKNNILVQSAQAMLAQANQVPQGVLQLLG